MNTNAKILIGGQALRELGSDRYTNDIDYLINDTTSTKAFITSKEVDYLNANGNKFFAEIFEIEKDFKVASPQSLLELKAYAFVQHCQNYNWKKVDACEYDIKFLVRTYNLTSIKIAKKYISEGELSEVTKLINETK